MSANREPPTFDERPPLDAPPVDCGPEDEGDGPTWEETHGADELTVRMRKRASAFASSFNAVIKAAGVDDACRRLDLDANEFRRMCLVGIEAAQRAEYAAERAAHPPPKVRRFKATAYVMELFYKRRQMPKGVTPDERKKIIDTLARNWRRRFKRFLAVQRFTHLGLFDYEPGVASSQKKVPPHLIDRLSDLLADVQRRAAAGGGEPIGRYDRAAAAALEAFRATFPPFAPEWKQEQEDEAGPKEAVPPRARDRKRVIERAARECVARVRELAQAEGLTEEEAEALREQLHAEIETAWSARPGPPPTSPPGRGGRCDVNADTPQTSTGPVNLDRTPVSYLTEAESTKNPTKTEVEPVENPEIPKAPAEQARQLIDAFESVGASEFQAVFLEAQPLDRQPRCLGDERGSAARMRARSLAFIERSERQRQSVSIRVWGGAIIQVDDASHALMARLLPFSFYACETSPGSYQVWLALAPEIGEEGRKAVRERLLRMFKSMEGETANGGAFNAVRLAGSLNAKQKYRQSFGEFPRVKLLHVALGRLTSSLELEHAGLLAPPLPKPAAPAASPFAGKLPSGWPDIREYRARKWKAGENRPDRSSAEAAWVGAAYRLGWPEHMIVAELERITEKGRGRRDGYCEKTVRNVIGYIGIQPDTRRAASRERMVI